MSKARRKKKLRPPKKKAPGKQTAPQRQTISERRSGPADRSFDRQTWVWIELIVLFASQLIIGTWFYASILEEDHRDFYYVSAQEDEYLEWGTFWAFMAACAVGAVAARRQLRATRLKPWFLLGVSLFCFVVAMEEISWGQRVFGYRPPTYFLEKNFQQELNVHNVIPTDWRKLGVKGVILGFGIVLPLVNLVPWLRKLLSRLAVVAPPAALVPAFASAFIFYQFYPWDFTGEWVEQVLGFGFLFAAIAALWQFSPAESPTGSMARLAWVLPAAWLAGIGAGFAHAEVSHLLRRGNPEIIQTARGELEALKRDFLSGEVYTECNRHRRLNTFRVRYGEDALLEGEFAALTAQGLPEERAKYFIDPWNSPYWIRDRCNSRDNRRIVFVYSFGPNRRRESSRWEILGDDVGVVIYDGRQVRRLPRSSR